VVLCWIAVLATAVIDVGSRRATLGRSGPLGRGPRPRRVWWTVPRSDPTAAARPSPVAALGRVIRRTVEPVTGTPAAPPWPPMPGGGRSPPGAPQDRRVGWAAIAGLALLPVAAPLALVPLACTLLAPAAAARRARRRYDDAVTDQVPDIVDLLALTTAAGLPVSVALEAIGDRPGGPVGTAIAAAVRHVQRGGTTADALASLAATGPPARPLVDALAQHDRYGTPLGPALDRVAIESRAHRRRRSEEAARRLPVTLLFPLVLTTFPAFVLLTVVPLLAGSLRALNS
jgi:tight adherence protein C